MINKAEAALFWGVRQLVLADLCVSTGGLEKKKTWELRIVAQNQDKGLIWDFAVILAEFRLDMVAQNQDNLNPVKLLLGFILCSFPSSRFLSYPG